MKILFYGAGVIGSLYAAKLQEAGNPVTVLARGMRPAAIVQHGIVLEHARTGARTATRIDVVQELKPDDAYDIAVVAVRKTDVDGVLPVLGAAT